MNRKRICLTVFAVALVCVGPMAFGQPNISVKIDDIVTNIADSDPFPDNLFDTSGPFPFSGTTTGGGNKMLAAVWEQTITLNIAGTPQTVGSIQGPPALGGQLQQEIQVTETASQMLYYEPYSPGDGNFVTSGDPFLFSSFNMTGGPMVLNLVDSDNNGGNGFTPYINNLFPQVPLPNGQEIAVWEGQPIQVEIVALTLTGLQPIAVNTMVPFQFFANDGTNLLDNAFGVFTDDWFLPLGPGVLLSEDGVGGPFIPSPFLMDWPNLPQTRAKGHPGGWVNVVVGPPPPGPAGIFHPTPGVPEPSTFVLAAFGLLSLTMIGRRRKRR